jgi:hypothetical protein
VFVEIRLLGDLSAAVPALWLALLAALIAYGAAVWLILRREHPRAQAGVLVLGAAIVFRLLLVDTAPSLSDDIYRYLWDARVQAAGHNPYAQAPASESLQSLRDADWRRINHPEIVTVYPPFSQWFFRAVYAVAPGVTGMKAAFVLCDLLLILGLWQLLLARGQDPLRVALYAWHPLPVIEIAGNGHVDVLGAALMVAALLCLHDGRRHVAAWVLTAATLTKMVPAVVMTAFWRHWESPGTASWRRWIDPLTRWPLLWLPIGVVAAYLPYLSAGDALWSGLRTFALKWRHNDSLYGVVYATLANPKPGWVWDDEALLLARYVCLALLALVGLVALIRCRDPIRIALAVLGAQLLLSPTVHPWYLLWILPLLPMWPAPAWMAFSWLVALSYQVLDGYSTSGDWSLAAWVLWVEYVPVYLLLCWPLGRQLWRRHGDRGQT